jgi:hypothetical protein
VICTVTEWIDLALLPNEDELGKALADLTDDERVSITRQMALFLKLDVKELEKALLRILVERARPFALSTTLWSRPVTASTDVQGEVRNHFERLGLTSTPERLRYAQQLYAQFAVDRTSIPMSISDLAAQNFRCWHCGLAFCDEDLANRGFESPYKLRGKPKTDPLKPHWHSDKSREPRMDHNWPVTLYGSNESKNIRVICDACNTGKANFIALEQTPSFSGLPRRGQLNGTRPLPYEVFYAQIRKSPICVRTGRTARQTELTVELIDPTAPAVLDNLQTVESPGI